MYKLSPSDFAYLYEECKLCYYLKIKKGIERPKSVMPGIFTAINTRLQGLLVGKDLQELSSDLPKGVVESQEGFIESVVFPNTNVYLKGKYDLLVRLPDNTHLIVDFKLSRPDEEKIQKYQTQLQSYKFAFENPKVAAPIPISQMGLIVMYPDQTKFENGKAILDFPPRWMEIPQDKEAFQKFMIGVNELLEGPEPAEGENCAWCRYRRLFPARQKPQIDLPF